MPALPSRRQIRGEKRAVGDEHSQFGRFGSAPMTALCFASVAAQGTMFERVGRYCEPALLNEHFDGTGWANPIRCGPAVHPVAATLSGLVLQVCVYVVG